MLLRYESIGVVDKYVLLLDDVVGYRVEIADIIYIDTALLRGCCGG